MLASESDRLVRIGVRDRLEDLLQLLGTLYIDCIIPFHRSSARVNHQLSKSVVSNPTRTFFIQAIDEYIDVRALVGDVVVVVTDASVGRGVLGGNW